MTRQLEYFRQLIQLVKAGQMSGAQFEAYVLLAKAGKMFTLRPAVARLAQLREQTRLFA